MEVQTLQKPESEKGGFKSARTKEQHLDGRISLTFPSQVKHIFLQAKFLQNDSGQLLDAAPLPRARWRQLYAQFKDISVI